MLDAVVIGGGFAGLAAAERLTRDGYHVTLLEARGRLGGRVRSLQLPGVKGPVEMGAEWFDRAGPVHELLTGAGHEVRRATGDFWQRHGQEYVVFDQPEADEQELRRRLGELKGKDRSLAAAIASCTPDGDLAHAATSLLRYVEGFHAADPGQLSLQWFREVEKSQPAEAAQYRAPGGLHQVSDRLVEQAGTRLVSHLDAPVRRVRWTRTGVRLDVGGELSGVTVEARRVVCTVPVALLSATNPVLEFSPSLGKRARAAEQLRTGSVIKTVLIFDRPFWQETAPREALFIQDFSQPVPTWWTWAPDDYPILTGWLGGPAAKAWDGKASAQLYHESLRACANAFDVTPDQVQRQLSSWRWHDWTNDPWSMGAYTWVATGGVNAHSALAEPLGGAVFFAGEATCGAGMNATMDGAIESGRRAAEAIIKLG